MLADCLKARSLFDMFKKNIKQYLLKLCVFVLLWRIQDYSWILFALSWWKCPYLVARYSQDVRKLPR